MGSYQSTILEIDPPDDGHLQTHALSVRGDEGMIEYTDSTARIDTNMLEDFFQGWKKPPSKEDI